MLVVADGMTRLARSAYLPISTGDVEQTGRMSARRMTQAERDVLTEMLSRDFAGAAQLRAQLAIAKVESSCSCGCGSIGFVFDSSADVPLSEAPNPVPVHTTLLGEDGAEIGGLVLLVRDGLLCEADVFTFFEPLPWPELTAIRWDA